MEDKEEELGWRRGRIKEKSCLGQEEKLEGVELSPKVCFKMGGSK
jgi:hypothetical protein